MYVNCRLLDAHFKLQLNGRRIWRLGLLRHHSLHFLLLFGLDIFFAFFLRMQEC